MKRKVGSVALASQLFLEITVFAPVRTMGAAPPPPSAAPRIWSGEAFASPAPASPAPPAELPTRVSVSSSEDEGNHESNHASLSGDGRYVAFESRASNLVLGDRNQAEDIFVRDRLAGTTERVSVASDGAEADGPSAEPAVSADGRYVAFASRAKNLSRNDRNERWDVFLHDRETRETIPISVNAEGVHGNHDSTRPALSADGWYVAFESRAGNLAPDDRNGRKDVFV
ncbi:MAG TPA: hypothetical protein VJH87_06650, partial [Vicinamibacteria bacterium]|nr:hypothetical protein [Vicinamibacteria bacterium]